MGIFSKIGKLGLNLLSNKAVKKVGGNSKIIKTTSQTIGSMLPSIAGGKAVGKTVAKATAKTVGGFAKVGGKFILGTGLIGASVVGGTKVYDYIQDVRTKTPEQRQAEDAFELWDDVNNSNNSNQKYSETDPSSIGDDGGSNFYKFYNDIKDGETEEAGQSGMSWGLILGAGAVIGGLFLANKKGYFKKRS